MADKLSALVRTTAPFRMSYATLIDPRPFMENGRAKSDPTYSVEAVFAPEDLETFEERVEGDWGACSVPHRLVRLAKEKWGEGIDLKKERAEGELSWPVQDGTRKAEKARDRGKPADHYDGKKVIRFKANQDYPPKLFCVEGGKYRELDRNNPADMAKAKQLFVSGNWAKANLNVVPQLVSGTKYLTFYVNSVLFYKEDEKIGGMSAEDRFGGIDGGVSDHDPTGEMDDEIPF